MMLTLRSAGLLAIYLFAAMMLIYVGVQAAGRCYTAVWKWSEKRRATNHSWGKYVKRGGKNGDDQIFIGA